MSSAKNDELWKTTLDEGLYVNQYCSSIFTVPHYKKTCKRISISKCTKRNQGNCTNNFTKQELPCTNRRSFIWYSNERYTRYLRKLWNMCLLIILISLLPITRTQSIRGITGSNTRCKIEGEVINTGFEIEGLRCLCRNGTVKCMRRSCQPTRGCFALMDYQGDNCPVQCQVCRYRDQVRKTSNEWTYQNNDRCRATTCKDGVITTSREQCYTDCTNPLPPIPGECCPQCEGCRMGGRQYSEGSLFKPPHDPCILCVCKDNKVSCSKKPCPVLACPRERTRKVGCCPQCVGQHRRQELPNGQCWKERGILKHGETYIPDKCTSCNCINGTVVCNRETCPLQLEPCKEDEEPQSKSSCCQKCFIQPPRNCKEGISKIRQHGATWISSANSCRQCACVNGKIGCKLITCENSEPKCNEGEVYDSVPGKCCKECIKKPGICSVFGDPHYRTFDGRAFNFQGKCRYVIAKDCENMNFTVVVQNDAKRSSTFSWTKSVELELMAMGDMKSIFIVLQSHLVVRVNGTKVALPYVSQYVTMQISRHILQVRTSVGVSLNWDGDSFLEVGAASKYQNKLCGLCGNFNGFQRDDFIGGDKTFKYDETSFGNSWLVKEDTDKCVREEAKPPNPCNKSLPVRIMARKKCQLFKTPSFAKCYKVVDPTEYYNSCVMDSCECPQNKKCSCESILAYTTACERYGILIKWQRAVHCKRTCRRGKVYSSCGPACRVNCRNHAKLQDKKCNKKCVAGCHCPAGTVLHRRRCVKIDQCPIYDRYKQNKPFSVILTRRHTKRRRVKRKH